jgi:hypothetical protein
MKTQTFKTKVTFLDSERKKIIIDIELKGGRFSMSADCGTSWGQCYDRISPDGDAQKDLLSIWRKWHLNDMQSGTPEQMSAIKGIDGYDKQVQHLKKINLYEVPHPTKPGETYKYGTSWLTKRLPTNLIKTIKKLIQTIEEEEEQKKGNPIEFNTDEELISIIEKQTNFEGEDAELCAAFVKMFDLSINDLQDIEIDGTHTTTIQGITYLAGNDEAMNECWDEDLDNYLDDCILPELPQHAQSYFDRERWKEDAKNTDGRANSLNRYDGSEEEAEINGTYYYAYRQ